MSFDKEPGLSTDPSKYKLQQLSFSNQESIHLPTPYRIEERKLYNISNFSHLHGPLQYIPSDY